LLNKFKYLIFILGFIILSQNVYSQFVDFGRNKVHYSEFDWKVLVTEHFQIYYYKEEKELENKLRTSRKELENEINHVEDKEREPEQSIPAI